MTSDIRQKAINKRVEQIRQNGINDFKQGLPLMPGQANPYIEGYNMQKFKMGLRAVK